MVSFDFHLRSRFRSALFLICFGLAVATAGLEAAPRAVTWGFGLSGQLGNGTNSTGSLPVRVSSTPALTGKTFSAIVAGGGFCVAITSEGQLFTWGDNSQGQLGAGVNFFSSSSSTPVAVDTSGVLSGKTVTAVAAGSEFALALTSEGKVYAWGSNTAGQLGDGTAVASASPVAVSLPGRTIVAISAAAGAAFAVADDGTLLAWGSDFNGVIGINGNGGLYRTPQVIPSSAFNNHKVKAVAAGAIHVLALTEANELYAWGAVDGGQIGNRVGTGRDAPPFKYAAPQAVYQAGALAGKTIARIAAGRNTSFAVTSDGQLYGWGNYNFKTYLVSDFPEALTAPARLDTLGGLAGQTVAAAAGGYQGSYFLTASGKVYAMGKNQYQALGVSTAQVATLAEAPVEIDTSGILAGLSVTKLSTSHSGYFVAALADAPQTTPLNGLINVSVRGPMGPGEEALIAGFVLTGSGSKPIVLRGIGPGLSGYGIAGASLDPNLSLYRSTTLLLSNEDWGGTMALADAFLDVGAFALPGASKDAALQTTLSPGDYTNVVAGARGVGLVEVYDAAIGAAGARLINISGRGSRVGSGENSLIAGFYISGSQPVRVLVRAIGPTLAAFNVSQPLANPRVELRNAAGALVASNDNWGGDAAVASASASSGAFALPANSTDAALLVTLSPGGYTAVGSSADSTSGTALVEVYEVVTP